jgi:uncharacterized protein
MAVGERPHRLRAPSANYGVFGTEEAALSAIVARLVEALDPEAIYLFGSRARGDATPYSDFDILLVTPTDRCRGEIDPAQAYAPLLGLGIACDVVACSREEFEREKLEKTGICRTAFREGRLLHERRR